MSRGQLVSLVVVVAALSGCSRTGDQPLMFVQADSLGITAAAGPSAAGADISLGYKGLNYASVPVSVRDDKGRVHKLGSVNSVCDQPETREFDRCEHDAYSVFGHFGASALATAGTTPQTNVGMQKFFATGIAATRLSRAFADKVAAEK